MRLADVQRDEDGLPIVSAVEERVSKAIAWVATVFFALVATWEIGGPVLAGHYASSASVGIIAENMWRWGIFGPVWEYTAEAPGPEAYYCHHPWGIFWTTALLMKVFGRHDFVCRLAPVMLSTATPPLLYGLGRALYRPASGAAAAAGFVVLPIALSFAAFNALEVPVMAWTLLGLFGFVRFVQTYRRRFGALAVVGLTLAMHADWPSFVLVAEILALGIVRLYVAPRVFGPVNVRRYVGVWIALACSAVLAGVLYLALFSRSGKLDDLLGAYELRSRGQGAPLSAVLARRRYWIELMFTPGAIFLGKVAAVVCLVRVALARREVEAIPLYYLGMCVFQYVVFKQGADIHVFWPHAFAAYFGLGVAALVATGAGLAEKAAEERGGELFRIRRERIAIAVMGVLALPLGLVLREALPTLVYARGTGGRFDEHGDLIDSDGGATAVLTWLNGQLGPEERVGLHAGMKPTWGQVWALGGRVTTVDQALPKVTAGPGRSAFVLDARFVEAEALRGLAARFQVRAVGPYWVVDRSKKGELEGFAIREQEPDWLTWYFVSGTEPVRTIVPDAGVTWELRAHFGGQAQAEDGSTAGGESGSTAGGESGSTAGGESGSGGLEERRILHNMAVAKGDVGRARELLGEIEAGLTKVGARFDDGTELLGVRFEDGVRPQLTLVLRAAGAMAKGVGLRVRSKVTGRPAVWLSMVDPQEREVGMPMSIPPSLWREGFLYSDVVTIRRRAGREVFAASFWSRRGGYPRPTGGQSDVEVLALP